MTDGEAIGSAIARQLRMLVGISSGSCRLGGTAKEKDTP